LIAAGDSPTVVYSLDSDASGLLLIARSPTIAEQLQAQVLERQMEQRYLALVRGRPGQNTGTISRYLFDDAAGGGVVRVDGQRGSPAITDWRLLESYVGFALLECTPRTLVRSQIRAHLQAADMPLLVDRRYGGGDALYLSSFKAGYRPSRQHEERPLIKRLTLHAVGVSFNHPTAGRQMRFEALPPKDFRAAMHQLGRFGRLPR
jgi:23S rRNA-/tRNA-specific pseudouridylate synthase